MTSVVIPAKPCLFRLIRDVDISGVSGVGVIVEGVMFSDGTTVTHWVRPPSSTAVFASVADMLDVHGHGGATRIQWLV